VASGISRAAGGAGSSRSPEARRLKTAAPWGAAFGPPISRSYPVPSPIVPYLIGGGGRRGIDANPITTAWVEPPLPSPAPCLSATPSVASVAPLRATRWTRAASPEPRTLPIRLPIRWVRRGVASHPLDPRCLCGAPDPAYRHPHPLRPSRRCEPPAGPALPLPSPAPCLSASPSVASVAPLRATLWPSAAVTEAPTEPGRGWGIFDCAKVSACIGGGISILLSGSWNFLSLLL
jgi:hypothetical protein